MYIFMPILYDQFTSGSSAVCFTIKPPVVTLPTHGQGNFSEMQIWLSVTTAHKIKSKLYNLVFHVLALVLSRIFPHSNFMLHSSLSPLVFVFAVCFISDANTLQLPWNSFQTPLALIIPLKKNYFGEYSWTYSVILVSDVSQQSESIIHIYLLFQSLSCVSHLSSVPCVTQ